MFFNFLGGLPFFFWGGGAAGKCSLESLCIFLVFVFMFFLVFVLFSLLYYYCFLSSLVLLFVCFRHPPLDAIFRLEGLL